LLFTVTRTRVEPGVFAVKRSTALLPLAPKARLTDLDAARRVPDRDLARDPHGNRAEVAGGDLEEVKNAIEPVPRALLDLTSRDERRERSEDENELRRCACAPFISLICSASSAQSAERLPRRSFEPITPVRAAR
jgi:hypothetical protein